MVGVDAHTPFTRREHSTKEQEEEEEEEAGSRGRVADQLSCPHAHCALRVSTISVLVAPLGDRPRCSAVEILAGQSGKGPKRWKACHATQGKCSCGSRTRNHLWPFKFPLRASTGAPLLRRNKRTSWTPCGGMDRCIRCHGDCVLVCLYCCFTCCFRQRLVRWSLCCSCVPLRHVVVPARIGVPDFFGVRLPVVRHCQVRF